MSNESTASSGPLLKRSLTLWNLVIIGIVIIQPIAPMGLYGIVNNAAGGHVVTTILIGARGPHTLTSARKFIPGSAT